MIPTFVLVPRFSGIFLTFVMRRAWNALKATTVLHGSSSFTKTPLLSALGRRIPHGEHGEGQFVLRPTGVHCSGTPESSRSAGERTPSARSRLTRVLRASCLLLWRDERRPSISRGQRAGTERVPARIGGRSGLRAGVGSRSAGGNACGKFIREEAARGLRPS